MASARWIEQLRSVSIGEAARRLGLEVSMEATDALDLVFRGLVGCSPEEASRAQHRQVRAQLAEVGLCEAEPPLRLLTAPRVVTTSAVLSLADASPRQLWARSIPAAQNHAVSGWLFAELGAHTFEALAEQGYCRALSQGALPSWATHDGRSWADLGFTALFPLVDAHGQICSLRAYRSTLERASGLPKYLTPKGYPGGLLACDGARGWLRTGTAPADWPKGKRFSIVIVQSALGWAWRSVNRFQAGAVLGVAPGEWTSEIASRVPDDAILWIRVPHDKAGESVAMAIWESLRHRPSIELMRSKPRGEP